VLQTISSPNSELMKVMSAGHRKQNISSITSHPLTSLSGGYEAHGYPQDQINIQENDLLPNNALDRYNKSAF
jgi:hypothetical protein